MDMKNKELEFEPPPIWPDIRAELRQYIECVENLPMYDLDNSQEYFPREIDILSLLDFDLSPIGTTLKFDRDPVTGELRDIRETSIKSAEETAKNSMSMSRAKGPASTSVRGDTSNILFWPGGFEEPEMIDIPTMEVIDFEKNLRTIARGFSSGVEFKSDNCTPKDNSEGATESSEPVKDDTEAVTDKINLMSIVHEEGSMFDVWSTPIKAKEGEQQPQPDSQVDSGVLEDITPTLQYADIPVLKISEKPSESNKSEWAEQIDVSIPVADFEKRIPNPALTFPYELDTFQKQAILKLEENSNVFVAAHTSAGKTTVAEYAIALSQKHMTRVIYTSPIKALSNQKYREFKRKFDSVGLLTGDVQINPEASCLIITTEILQSMIYGASDVLRDLEFVIFDEVHYITNEDRGHVWEESVILLPPTVCIVMLSATVPNPIIFADWVGRTKKKKMYVISTVKRPVPLEHYLYTGTDGKTKDDRFLVLDSTNQFLLDGWYKAVNAKTPKNTKTATDVKKRTYMTPKQEQVLWNAFITHLKANNMLPVVVFMLSRKRCDTTAVLLRNIDLTTATEKHSIRVFFQNNIKHLKGTDRQLPQVLMMQELLQQGIGIHHSGILPILKEIVEMLFQNGVVKLLFATETFAMGVNMPARTVVFSSVKKYDGTNFRMLHPTEYIQMAGRAGRRGHDTAGMVIIMCPLAIPHFNEIKAMMCGQPQNLESKFKVTYSMVLNLRRLNNSVTVEAMMRRSFKELPFSIQQSSIQAQLKQVEKQLFDFPPLTDTQQNFADFYQAAVDYIEYNQYIRPIAFESKRRIVKNLTPGRVLLISFEKHYNKLAILLEIEQTKKGQLYKVLVLDNAETSKNDEYNSSDIGKLRHSKEWCEIIALTKKEIFTPTGVASSCVLTINAWHILEITSCQIKVEHSLVLANWEKRQIPRFKDDPPGETYQIAVSELMTLSLNASRDPTILQPYTSIDTYSDGDANIQHLISLKNAVDNMKCTEVANFEQQFLPVFERSRLEHKQKKLLLKCSDEDLSLYPDYVNAVALLKELGYIDQNERVTLKGRVALQMGCNELFITELILKNILTVLRPAEIAALLSALIFQQRTEVAPALTPELTKQCEIITQIHAELESLEQRYSLPTLLPLNFGLVEVVYEWAMSKSFAEIMEKTDVQEGIIVRCIQQLSETLRDVRNAAITIGDPVLREKMEEASRAIKRDIVFAASLYIQE